MEKLSEKAEDGFWKVKISRDENIICDKCGEQIIGPAITNGERYYANQWEKDEHQREISENYKCASREPQ